MTMPRVRCGTNERCSACPIERIVNAEWRSKAADIVRLARQDLDATFFAPAGFVTVNTMEQVVAEKAEELGAIGLLPEALGSLAITLGAQCERRF